MLKFDLEVTFVNGENLRKIVCDLATENDYSDTQGEDFDSYLKPNYYSYYHYVPYSRFHN